VANDRIEGTHPIDITQSIQITQRNLLVVEGVDDQLFFCRFAQHIQAHDIQIMPIGGKTKLRGNLKLLKLSPNFDNVTSLCIVRDANDNPTAAFRSVCAALKNVNLPAPQRARLPTNSTPHVTVIILPNETESGMLEDLCLRAVASDPAMPCVARYFQCLQQEGHNLPRNLSKAKIHAFLASRPDPEKRLGQAAQANYWPLDHEAFSQLRDSLQIALSHS